MKKIDWASKLTSRKFWAAVIGFVTSLLVGLGLGENDVAQVTSIIMSGATLIAYIIGEGMVDAKRAENSCCTPVEQQPQEPCEKE